MAQRKTKKREVRSTESPTMGNVLQKSAVGAGISFLVTLLLTLICAFFCSMLSDPSAVTPAVGTGASFLCYLLAGILTARKVPSSILLSGMFSGAILSVLLLVVGLVTGGFSLTPISWLLRLLGVGFSVTGAYLASGHRASSHRTKRHSHGR